MANQPPFKSIMLTGEVHVSRRENQSHADAFRALCQQAKRIGMTHLQVNFLADPYHPILLEQPGNHYAWFASYGAALDQFVSSRLNRGLYLEAYLARNRQQLVEAARGARREGLKPVLMLCEPRFVPERFLQIHPRLRGPRVDNPGLSTTPLYALCTDLPETREHYREMLTTLMQHVPELAGISVFTNDSGAGFCHSRGLYAGPNGPRHCSRINVGHRIAAWLGDLQGAGAKINPDFFVSLSTGVENQERLDFLSAAPPSVSGEVQGKWSWLGGLEDQWAAHQYGSRITEVGYKRAQQERIEEFLGRVEAVRRTGQPVVAICSMPTEGFYPPIKYVPHPFQNLEILHLLRQLGVDRLNCKGNLTVPPFVSGDVNAEVFRAFQETPDVPVEAVVRSVAHAWGGDVHAEALVEAWRLTDLAQRRRPLWMHMFGYGLHYLPGPLVPDPARLSDEETAYYLHQSMADFESIPGRDRWGELRIAEPERAWMVQAYATETIPLLEKARQGLETQLSRCTDPTIAARLREQADQIRHFQLWQQCAYNWCEAGAYWMPGAGAPASRRALPEIIADEMATREALIALLRGRAEQFLWLGPVEGLLYDKSPRFVEQLVQSVDVMRRHQPDAVR